MEWYIYAILFITGIVTGFINTLAGSGSLISLPVLMFAGLPANIANGTNRIGILLQSITALFTFKKGKMFEWNEGISLLIPSAIGAIAGALSAVNLDKASLEIIIGFLLVVMFFIVLLKPDKWIKNKAGEVKSINTALKFIVFLFIGFYGGFIQAGVGFFLLAGLVLAAGYDLLKANTIKILITAVFTIFALPIYIYNNQIDWLPGISLAGGSIIGAWIAAKLAIKKGAPFIRIFLLVILIISAAKFLKIENWF